MLGRAALIRVGAGLILDSLPRSETFDWVELVSKELIETTVKTDTHPFSGAD